MIYIREDQIGSYQELWAEAINAAVVKGQVVIINDVMCFYLTAGAIGDKVVPVWECKQVLADKVTGTGTEIERGQKIF